MAITSGPQISLNDVITELGHPMSFADMRDMASKWQLIEPDLITEFYGLSTFSITLTGPFILSGSHGYNSTYIKEEYLITSNGLPTTHFNFTSAIYLNNPDSGYHSYAKYKINNGSEILIHDLTGTGFWSNINWISPLLNGNDTLHLIMELSRSTAYNYGTYGFWTVPEPCIINLSGGEALLASPTSGQRSTMLPYNV